LQSLPCARIEFFKLVPQPADIGFEDLLTFLVGAAKGVKIKAVSADGLSGSSNKGIQETGFGMREVCPG
jgi:hypothetical protein